MAILATSVIIARRKGRTWYVGGLNGDAVAKTHTVPMELLGTGLFDMVLVADGPSATELLVTKRQRNATDVQASRWHPTVASSCASCRRTSR